MAIGHCFSDRAEQGQPGFTVQIPRFAIALNGFAIDVFHDQIGQAGLGQPAIDDLGNVGMREPGENLQLVAQMLLARLADLGRVQQLDRDRHFKLAVGALAMQNHTHAAAADFIIDDPGTETLAFEVLVQRRTMLGVFTQSLNQGIDVLVDERRIVLIMGGQQLIQPGARLG